MVDLRIRSLRSCKYNAQIIFDEAPENQTFPSRYCIQKGHSINSNGEKINKFLCTTGNQQDLAAGMGVPAVPCPGFERDVTYRAMNVRSSGTSI